MQTFIPEEFVSGDLNQYGTDGRRAFCMTLMDIYVPSKVGEDHFKAICQGRAEAAKATKDFFSTCGELAMFQLHQMGYRGSILNRTLRKDRDGLDRGYRYGANMSKLLGTATSERVFINFKAGMLPNPGDICFLSNGPSKTEHVFIFKQQIVKDVKGNLLPHWESYDAGQIFEGMKWNQSSKICERLVTKTNVGGRTCWGWIDISLLKLTATAQLEALNG